MKTSLLRSIGFTLIGLWYFTGLLVGEERTWTRASDKQTLTADFVSADDTEVRLRRPDGSVITLKIKQLTHLDQAYIAGRVAPYGSQPDVASITAVPMVDRMEPLRIETIVADPKLSFEVDDFSASIVRLVHGGEEMRVGGFGPSPGFGFGVVRIKLTPKTSPLNVDLCGFYLRSPQGKRYPVHVLVVDAADGSDGRRALRDVRGLEVLVKDTDTQIENTYVYMIPMADDFLQYELCFEAPVETESVEG